ncbi:MAG: hypothetical protein SWX82_27060 [Cyanobacteriota bacterium]|nr:hypothetical protein [Cyanobacteriota bacterium]
MARIHGYKKGVGVWGSRGEWHSPLQEWGSGSHGLWHGYTDTKREWGCGAVGANGIGVPPSSEGRPYRSGGVAHTDYGTDTRIQKGSGRVGQ